jgi:transcriptional regulator of acetoin/glycerol metabolism
MPKKVGAVRPIVYQSWRRSKLQGLDPDRVAPRHCPDLELDGYLTRVVEPVVDRHRAVVEQTGFAVSLTDQEGRLLRRWAPDRTMARRLDALGVAPRFSVSESHVGTTSAISLLAGSPLLVRGPEHFAENLRDLTCGGAPIVNPVTRRMVGSLNVSCRLEDTSPLLLSWVEGLAREVEQILRDSACRREQLLLSAYLVHDHDARHPLVALNENTIISNAAAARLLGPVDQAMLWECACRAIRDRRYDNQVLTLVEGVPVLVETHPVCDGPDIVGAVVKLKATTTAVTADKRSAGGAGAFRLPGLAGVGPRWLNLCAQAARLGPDGRVLLVGEAGSGRVAVARALAGRGPVRVLDARDVESIGAQRWLCDVESEIDGAQETLILRHVDLLGPGLAAATDAALGRRPSGRRVFATSQFGPLAPGRRHPLVDTFAAVLDVPPLRERIEDLPALVNTLTARVVGDGPAVRWMPAAVQALSRLEWPGNVAALAALVRRLVAGRRGGYIGVGDLPADVTAGTARRRLGALEQAEAKAILAALRDADGNKHRASQSLGIARSTLYRKIRALGLDLSASAF